MPNKENNHEIITHFCNNYYDNIIYNRMLRVR